MAEDNYNIKKVLSSALKRVRSDKQTAIEQATPIVKRLHSMCKLKSKYKASEIQEAFERVLFELDVFWESEDIKIVCDLKPGYFKLSIVSSNRSLQDIALISWNSRNPAVIYSALFPWAVICPELIVNVLNNIEDWLEVDHTEKNFRAWKQGNYQFPRYHSKSR